MHGRCGTFSGPAISDPSGHLWTCRDGMLTACTPYSFTSPIIHFGSCNQFHVLEIGPKGWANRHDSRLLRLMFKTNSCKYNALSLGFQHTLSSEEAKEKNKIK